MTLPVFVDPRDHDAVLIELDSLINGAGSRRPYHRAREFVRELASAGVRTAAYCSAGGCPQKLRSTGLNEVFAAVVDGPAREAADKLGLPPNRCVVVDHTPAGVAAACEAGFGLVIGVDLTGDAVRIVQSGADAVVPDVVTLSVRGGYESVAAMPDALAAFDEVASLAATRRPVVLLDFDGTLSEIVDDPTKAELLPSAADVVENLASHCAVAILSGRGLADLRDRVKLHGVWYGGSHGIELVSPDGVEHPNPRAEEARLALSPAGADLTAQLGEVQGIVIEDKRFALAVHYRNVADEAVDAVIAAVRTVGRAHHLGVSSGRMVIELRPGIDWDKGRAVNWILNQIDGEDLALPVYIGDDSTDEDAFDVLRHKGVGIAVRQGVSDKRKSSARFCLDEPEAVCTFLSRLAQRLADEADSTGDSWSLVFDGYAREQERLRESLCTTGNGYLAVRGAAPEAHAGQFHYPGHYVAGVYNRLTDVVAGTPVTNESLVNLPNWLPVSFRVNGAAWFDIDRCPPTSYRVTFALRRATLIRTFTVCDEDGRTTEVTQRRFVSMQQPHVAAMQTVIRPLDWTGLLEIRSTVDGGVANTGVERYRDLASKHLDVNEIRELSEDCALLAVETTQSRVRVALTVRNTLRCDGAASEDREVRRMPIVGDAHVGHQFLIDVVPGNTALLEKTACVFTSRDHGIGEPVEAAIREISRVADFAELQRGHQLSWAHLWERFTIDVSRDVETLRVVRLHQLHLLQTLSRHTADLDVGVPARGLHGEAYRGHVFWDELFVFPVTNLRMPEVTRSLLMYRYRRLPEARLAAHERGYRGAMFPWQSGSSGREESQQLHLNPTSGHWNPDASARAHHVGIAIAYNVWQYFQVTGDSGFLIDYGAEMLAEIARFWVSLARFDSVRNRYVVTGVIGPDEFHSGYPGRDYDGIDNNAYTNVMAVWVILRALETLERVPLSYRLTLLEKLGIDDDELVRWEDVSRRMFVPFHDGVISQFEGYERLRELDWETYRTRYGDLRRLDRILDAENDSTNNYKAAKQADTVMLFYLLSADELYELFDRLGYTFSPEQIPATIDYYRSRTSHGSTLSAVVHSWVTARGNRTEAMRYFKQVLDSDVVDIQRGTTAEGIHLAAMAGSVDLLQRCFTGLELRDEQIVIGPLWPESLGGLAFSFRYRGHRLRLSVRGRGATLSAEPGDAPPVQVECRGAQQTLVAGGTVRFSR
ncbi:trehalose-phosphatase [Mycolicibacterium sp. BiH015]|uniref:trehalose-phosphatase n=1 Tax=Mycolicibacterium sp. BiH015 TaxID=3018808 RepID=UPI0022E956B1|nr:trehalose-phosphatase [Mycolicibacterium sp. BiH015]MDA2891231.1 trehalose-phosphatase [Mycolicibacterium sp. BiH015]